MWDCLSCIHKNESCVKYVEHGKCKNYEPTEKPRCRDCEYFHTGLEKYPCCDCFYTDRKHFKARKDVKEIKDDPVSHPNHYQSKTGLEVIDVIRAFTENLTGVESYYTGNILKYMCRWKKKNGLEDLKKARQYLDWLIVFEDPDMSEKDRKSELNRIYGVGIFDDFKNFWGSLPDDAKEYARNLANEEKKEPPKNESDCCSGKCKCESKKEDCFVPWQIQPKMVPTYEFDPSYIKNQIAVETIWNQFCDAFLNALKEVNEEEKENKEDEE